MTSTSFAVDFARTANRIRPLHGGNNGPMYHGGTIDLSALHRRLRIPLVRLHDCDWPGDYLVDIHAVFPDPDADPEDPASYDFINTDDYIARIVALGSQIVYRLGCRIEHTRRRLRTTPPASPERWARICLGIIRHYNHGWADGHHWGIRYWEIWNEPDCPPGCWSGTWEDYFRLYAVASTAIKTAFPDVRVGGPAYAVGIAGKADPGESAFASAFVGYCHAHRLPLDFFSWHTYVPGDLTLWATRARNYRAILDEHGYTATESHLNEWHILPVPGSSGPDWHAAETMQGPVGAAAVAASLIYFQDLPIDAACLYTMDPAACYGMFTMGARPQPTYHAVAAFAELLDTPCRCPASGGDPASGLAILAGLSEHQQRARILAANYIHSPAVRIPLRLSGLPWSGNTAVSIRRLDAGHDLTESERQVLPPGEQILDLGLPRASVVLIELRPAPAGARPGPLITVDAPSPVSIGPARLTLAGGRPALMVELVNLTADPQPAEIVTTFAPAWVSTPPRWTGTLETEGNGRNACLLPFDMTGPDADRTMRLHLRCAGLAWPIAADVPLMSSGRPEALADWARLTPRLDAAGLHLRMEIRDADVQDHRDGDGPPRSPFQGACAEFFFDWDRCGDLDQPAYNGDDMQIVCTPPGLKPGDGPLLRILGSRRFGVADVAYAACRTPVGWTCDLSIPWDRIEAAGGGRGQPIACSAAARATDATGRERQWVSWAGGNGNWCSTAGFGLLLPGAPPA